MTETIKVSESLELHAVAESHVTPLYQLICKNKTWLQQSLNWPQFVQSEEDTRKTVQGNVMLHQRGYAKMFMIFKEDELIGVISFNRIEPLNKTAEIGYWLDESHQGQGIISQALDVYKRQPITEGNIPSAAVGSAPTLTTSLLRPSLR